MFYILEIQTNKDGTSAYLMYTESTLAAAESKFHTVLSAAAISPIYSHSASIIDSDGNLVKNEIYRHEPVEDTE